MGSFLALSRDLALSDPVRDAGRSYTTLISLFLRIRFHSDLEHCQSSNRYL